MKLSRRTFGLGLGSLSLLSACARPLGTIAPWSTAQLVNDSQSRLNATWVSQVHTPSTPSTVADLVRQCRRDGMPLAVCGGRHAMGGQQFRSNGALLDSRSLSSIGPVDQARRLVTIGTGVQWPELIDALEAQQGGRDAMLTIREKQTGVDKVCLGGTIAANAHGRGLHWPPFVHDIERMTVVTAAGEVVECSRRENRELFSLIVGGYGLFGIVCDVTLRLVPRTKVQRHVEVILLRDLLTKIEQRRAAGYLYGDCQYSIDLRGSAEEYPGVFSCYRPVADDVEISAAPLKLNTEDWIRLYGYTRTDKRRAFEEYARYYASTNGQVYWSDRHQLAGTFFDAYRLAVQDKNATEVLTEVYIPYDALFDFLRAARDRLIGMGADLTYGTIRFIEKDQETFLAWAKDRCVCIVCNLNVTHSTAGIERAAAQFRELIDLALDHGGRYFLTYHRWATTRQVTRAYPQFTDFLKLKLKYDPALILQSDWFNAYKHILTV